MKWISIISVGSQMSSYFKWCFYNRNICFTPLRIIKMSFENEKKIITYSWIHRFSHVFFFYRFTKLPSPIFIHVYDPFMNTERPLSPPPSLLKAARALCPQNVPVFLTLLVIFSPLSLPLFPVGTRGFKIKIGPPYPNAHRKRRPKWGGFSE